MRPPRPIRILPKKWQQQRDAGRLAREADDLALVRGSSWFDADWYIAEHLDVAAAGGDPALHFLRHGGHEGRDPGPRFRIDFYRERYPDVAESGLNPLLHFLRIGEGQGRTAHPAPTPPPPALAIPGDDFASFSTSDPIEILRRIAAGATPAERLARVDDTLASPLISLLCPTWNTPPRYLREMVQSVRAQTWARWELCLVDDGSTAPATLAELDALEREGDSRLRIRRRAGNGGIAIASQDALEMAGGDYVGFLDHDDLLTPNALSEVVAALRDDPGLDYVYTDHVNVAPDGMPRHHARKPGWSPEFLLSTNYIVHFKLVRRATLNAIGGLAGEVAGAQDLGMSLRLMAAGAKVGHVPAICYLWREAETSVASSTSAKPGIEEALVAVWDRHFAAIGNSARQSWPGRYRATRTGLFRPAFGPLAQPLTLIVLVRGPGGDEAAIRARLLPAIDPLVDVRLVSLGAADGLPAGTTPLAADGELLDTLRGLSTDHVGIVNSTARHLGIDWLGRLAGYLSLDEAIAAAGGKALDRWLRVRGAGALVGDDGGWRMIGGGRHDFAPTHWFTGEIASNVDALPTLPIVARREALIAAGGLPLHADGDAAGIAFSKRVRAAGLRLVYDPAATLVDEGRVAVPEATRQRLATGARGDARRLYAARSAGGPAA